MSRELLLSATHPRTSPRCKQRSKTYIQRYMCGVTIISSELTLTSWWLLLYGPRASLSVCSWSPTVWPGYNWPDTPYRLLRCLRRGWGRSYLPREKIQVKSLRVLKPYWLIVLMLKALYSIQIWQTTVMIDPSTYSILGPLSAGVHGMSNLLWFHLKASFSPHQSCKGC